MRLDYSGYQISLGGFAPDRWLRWWSERESVLDLARVVQVPRSRHPDMRFTRERIARSAEDPLSDWSLLGGHERRPGRDSDPPAWSEPFLVWDRNGRVGFLAFPVETRDLLLCLMQQALLRRLDVVLRDPAHAIQHFLGLCLSAQTAQG